MGVGWCRRAPTSASRPSSSGWTARRKRTWVEQKLDKVLGRPAPANPGPGPEGRWPVSDISPCGPGGAPRRTSPPASTSFAGNQRAREPKDGLTWCNAFAQAGGAFSPVARWPTSRLRGSTVWQGAQAAGPRRRGSTPSSTHRWAAPCLVTFATPPATGNIVMRPAPGADQQTPLSSRRLAENFPPVGRMARLLPLAVRFLRVTSECHRRDDQPHRPPPTDGPAGIGAVASTRSWGST